MEVEDLVPLNKIQNDLINYYKIWDIKKRQCARKT